MTGSGHRPGHRHVSTDHRSARPAGRGSHAARAQDPSPAQEPLDLSRDRPRAVHLPLHREDSRLADLPQAGSRLPVGRHPRGGAPRTPQLTRRRGPGGRCTRCGGRTGTRRPQPHDRARGPHRAGCGHPVARSPFSPIRPHLFMTWRADRISMERDGLAVVRPARHRRTGDLACPVWPVGRGRPRRRGVRRGRAGAASVPPPAHYL